MLQSTRAEREQQMELARQQQVAVEEQQKGGSAFFKVAKLAGTVASAVGKAASSIHTSAENQVRQMADNTDRDRFAFNFPELVAAGEQLICDYKCKVLSQGQSFTGHFQLSIHYLCFISESLRDIIPLNEIASIQRSVTLETIDNGPPFVMPCPAPHVLPDCLQIFTVKQQVFQFLHFESTLAKVGGAMTTTLRGRPIDRAYNFLDHAWRKAVQVPLPGYQYAPY
jgi:hypothetical protein